MYQLMDCDIYSSNENDKLIIPKKAKIEIIQADDEIFSFDILKNVNDLAKEKKEYLIEKSNYRVRDYLFIKKCIIKSQLIN
jgi:hypothetical protein